MGLEAPTYAGSSTTARWNGITVGMPSTTNSASARRLRSRAWVRSRPVTMSLAISESNEPGIVSPFSYPPSRRTPGPCGGCHADSVPGAGMKLRPPSSALMRNSMEWPRIGRVVVPELLAGRDPEHLAHQVDAGDLLGDAVLDLEPGVDLEEGDGAVPGDQELAGAGADVPRLAQDRLAGLVEPGDLVVGEERRGRLLDQLLVAALERAVAGGDDDDVAVLVGQALGLDVPRLVEELLDQALAAAERPDRLADRRLVELGDLLQRAGDLEATATAAEDRLDGDRQAVLLRERDDLVGVLDGVLGAGGQRGVGLLRDVLGLGLVAEALDRRRRRPDPRRAPRR